MPKKTPKPTPTIKPEANPKAALFLANATAHSKYFPGPSWLEHKGRIIAVFKNFERQTGLAASAVIGHSTANVFGRDAESKASFRVASERAQKCGHSAFCRFALKAPTGIAWVAWAVATDYGTLWSTIPVF